jgi:tetratricopeptide (TPR) repeat protein
MKRIKHDGYIDPSGNFVRMDNLEAMERSLMRYFYGDMAGVLYGLRKVSLELAKKHDDAAARRFLGRERELDGGALDEGPRLVLLGIEFEKIQRYDLAVECYKAGELARWPEDVQRYFLYNNHAYCLVMLERFAEAETLARRAIQIDLRRHNAHKNLGLALMGLGRLPEAAQSFRLAQELCPGDGRAAQYLAMVERKLGLEPDRKLN